MSWKRDRSRPDPRNIRPGLALLATTVWCSSPKSPLMKEPVIKGLHRSYLEAKFVPGDRDLIQSLASRAQPPSSRTAFR